MGVFQNLRRTRGGNLFTKKEEIINEADNIRGLPDNIARGLYPGATPFGSFGERTTSGPETNVPIWPNGPIMNIPPVTGVQMSIVSTSANDSAAGTNVRTLEIHYLDINLDTQHEDIILNGITPVLTVATDIRFIQCMHITTVGVNAFAEGTIQATESATIYSEIAAGEERCSSSYIMVPKGKKFYVRGAVGGSVSGTAQARTLLRIVATELDNHQYLNPPIFMRHTAIPMQDNSNTYSLPVPLVFNAGTVVGMQHSSDKAVTVAGSLIGTLEPAEDSNL